MIRLEPRCERQVEKTTSTTRYTSWTSVAHGSRLLQEGPTRGSPCPLTTLMMSDIEEKYFRYIWLKKEVLLLVADKLLLSLNYNSFELLKP